jgi:hypothetical protein
MSVGQEKEHCMRALTALLFTTLTATLAQPAAAQSWPQRPVTFIVSQSAGASPDVMARMIANKLSAALGQSVIVENKPGAGNVIGAQAAARAAPDGYTFFFATSAALVTNPYMVKNLSYDPVKDFVPVALVTRSHQVIVAHPDVAAKSLADLIALDKKEPGKLSISVDGARNLAGVTAQALNKRAGTQIRSGALGEHQQRPAGHHHGAHAGRRLLGLDRGGACALGRGARAGDRIDASARGRARCAGRGRDAAGLRFLRLVHGDGAGRNAGRNREEAQRGDRRGDARRAGARSCAEARLRAGSRRASARRKMRPSS